MKTRNLFLILMILPLLIAAGTASAWQVSGTVMYEDGETPFDQELAVEVVDNMQEVIASMTTEDGSYNFTDLATEDGAYFAVRAMPSGEEGWYCRTYSGNSWFFFGANQLYAQEEDNYTDIDFSMLVGGTVTGSVTKTGGGEFEDGEVEIHIFPYYWGPDVAEVFTPEDPSNYSINLPQTFDGENENPYALGFVAPNTNYMPQFFDGVSSPWQAEPISVTIETVHEGYDAEMMMGVKLFGTIQDPDGNVPDSEMGDLIIEIQTVSQFIFGEGNSYQVNMWDEEGNWDIMVTPGIYSFYIYSWGENNWVRSYSNGSLTAWGADWVYCSAEACGPFDITLEEGGMITGTVTNPDGGAGSEVSVDIYQGDSQVYSGWTDYESGDYIVNGVKPGEYYIAFMPEVENYDMEDRRDGELDRDRLWPTVYSGGSSEYENRSTLEVTAGNETVANVNLIQGGGLEVTALDADGEPFAFEEGLWGFVWSIDSDGNVDYNAANAEDDETGVTGIALAPGDYRTGFMPIYLAGIASDETPSVMRTLVGGTFGLDGATTLTVAEGEVTSAEITAQEGGHAISGVVVNEDADEIPNQVFIVDEDAYLVAGSFSYFMNPNDVNGDFLIKGIPDGDYYVLYGTGESGLYGTTWYPDVAMEGLDAGLIEIPEGAETITVDGADVSGLELVLIRNANFVSVEEPAEAVTPDDFRLYSAYPNPFNDKSNIVFNLKRDADIQIALFDVAGRKVADIANGRYNAGMHHAAIDAAGLATGAYFVRMSAPGYEASQKIMLLK